MGQQKAPVISRGGWGSPEVVFGPGLDLSQGHKALNLSGVTQLEAVAIDSEASIAHVNHEYALPPIPHASSQSVIC